MTPTSASLTDEASAFLLGKSLRQSAGLDLSSQSAAMDKRAFCGEISDWTALAEVAKRYASDRAEYFVDNRHPSN